jgi:hypothetical protein
MAIEPAHMSGADEPVPSREVVPTKNTGRPKRPTGPRTARGKRASSKNATRHGILSRSPVIGSESERDWEEHLRGIRASLRPVGQYEEVLVHRAALNRWRRARVDEWANGVIEGQLATVGLAEIFDGDSSLPQPVWTIPGVIDPARLLATLIGIDRQSDRTPVPSEDAAGVIAVLRHSGRSKWNTKWAGLPDRAEPEEFDGWTAGQLRQCLTQVAEECNCLFSKVFSDAKQLLEETVQFWP